MSQEIAERLLSGLPPSVARRGDVRRVVAEAVKAGQESAYGQLRTTAQTAAALGISPTHVKQLADRLKVGIRAGERVMLFRPEDIEAMRARRTAIGRPKKQTE